MPKTAKKITYVIWGRPPGMACDYLLGIYKTRAQADEKVKNLRLLYPSYSFEIKESDNE